jgi:virulence factor Mce-like protein
MENKRLEIKVGLFVFIGLALMAILMVQFNKGTNLWSGTYTLHLHAENVGGIKQRASVLLAGVPVGTVSNVRLDPAGKSVTIDLEIYKNTTIYHDARFVIESAGFLGDQFVSIIPTSNSLPVLVNGADVPCQAPFNLQQVARDAAGFIQRIDETTKKLDASVTDLRSQVLNEQTLSSFGTSITNLKKFTEEALGAMEDINAIVNTNGAQVGIAVSNVTLFSSELIQLAGTARDVLATNSVQIGETTKNLADTTSVFKQLAADLQAGKGLAGAVLQSPELATNVQNIAANLAITSSNLNRRGLWGILWTQKAVTTEDKQNNNRDGAIITLPPKK